MFPLEGGLPNQSAPSTTHLRKTSLNQGPRGEGGKEKDLGDLLVHRIALRRWTTELALFSGYGASMLLAEIS